MTVQGYIETNKTALAVFQNKQALFVENDFFFSTVFDHFIVAIRDVISYANQFTTQQIAAMNLHEP